MRTLLIIAMIIGTGATLRDRLIAIDDKITACQDSGKDYEAGR